MPYGGYDPLEHGQGAEGFDPVGNSIDPSYYYALSPGGRFPGDVWSYLEGQAGLDRAADRTSAEANPDYNAPDWLERIPGRLGNIIARLVRGHEANVRGNADAAGSNPLRGGDVYQGWSGPGAPYGPAGGPLHGLLDQGSDHLGDFDIGDRRVVDGPTGPGGGRRRGGGGGPSFAPLNFQPYGGTTANASFVGYDPIQPFMAGDGRANMVTRPLNAPAPAAPLPPGRPGGGRSGPGRGGRRDGGRGRGGGITNKPGGGMSDLNAEILRLLFPEGSRAGDGRTGATAAPPAMGPPRPRPGVSPSQMDYGRGGGERGYDTNYLERGTPGWMRDPTTGILNTAGMPRPTVPARVPGESTDDYITHLHNLGFDNESIIGILSNEWGTGPVVRGPDGYMFANDPRNTGGTLRVREYLSPLDPSNYVATGGAGGGLGQDPESASTMLSSGWTPTARYF